MRCGGGRGGRPADRLLNCYLMAAHDAERDRPAGAAALLHQSPSGSRRRAARRRAVAEATCSSYPAGNSAALGRSPASRLLTSPPRGYMGWALWRGPDRDVPLGRCCGRQAPTPCGPALRPGIGLGGTRCIGHRRNRLRLRGGGDHGVHALRPHVDLRAPAPGRDGRRGWPPRLLREAALDRPGRRHRHGRPARGAPTWSHQVGLILRAARRSSCCDTWWPTPRADG